MNNVRTFQGMRPRIGSHCWIDPSAVVIGDVTLGRESSVWPLTVIRGDINRIRIGRRTSVQDGSVLHVTHDGPYNPGGFPLTVGDEVTIGHQVTLHGCTLGDRILVGMATVIMDGAVVEDEVIIGAGSLVTPGKTLESGHLYLGRPAEAVRPLTERELGYFAYTAQRYVDLARQYIDDSASWTDP
jgi:carbonic anhydrase/acetyltransferase-like protein (isoleucine patch superfamily)